MPRLPRSTKKQHALGAGELDQTVAQDDREQRLAGAGGHLHERARPVVAQGLLDVHDRLRLGRPNVVDQRRHVLDAAEEVAFAAGVFGDRVDGLRRSVVFHPCEQSLRPVKGEDVAAARLGIEPVGEAGFRAGGLVGERQRRAPGGNTERHALHILLGLLLDAGERMARGFGLDRADRFAVDKERVVRLAGL